ncbi:hypothetical protein D3C87_517890 [compost metagenome]
MSADELNFKKLSNEKYRIYRLLQSPVPMIETYRRLIKEVGTVRGAVIFPEQFISLYGQSICRVSLNRSQDKVSASAEMIRSFSLWGYGADKALRTFDEVLAIEKKCSQAGDDFEKMFSLKLERPKNESSYYGGTIDLKFSAKEPIYWFSNKADGLAFLRKNIVI